MPVAMKLIAWANGKPLAAKGQYVKWVDVQQAGISDTWLVPTPNIEEAKLWSDLVDLFMTWNEVLERDPVRPDGMPNKPLTALTIQPVPVDKGKLQ